MVTVPVPPVDGGGFISGVVDPGVVVVEYGYYGPFHLHMLTCSIDSRFLLSKALLASTNKSIISLVLMFSFRLTRNGIYTTVFGSM